MDGARPSQLRNRIVHGYWSIDLAILHTTAVHDLPICQGVTAVVDGRVTPEQLTGALMSRARKHELA